jgi:hypothetical protein
VLANLLERLGLVGMAGTSNPPEHRLHGLSDAK